MRYLRRKNLGNYEHEELEVSAEISEGQSPSEAFKELKQFVEECLGLSAPKEQMELPLKVEKEKVKTPKKEEVKVSEEKPKEVEAPKEEEKKKAPKETKQKIKVTAKATTYDRTLDTHKALLGQFLDKEFSGWRKPEELKKAGQASRELNGKDFQDADGNILESFKESFRKYMV